MDILAHNLNQLKIVPGLKEQLLSHTCGNSVNIKMQGAGRFTMTYDGQQIYDLDEPVGNAAMEIQRLQGDVEQDLVVYFGFGLGLHAEFLKKRFHAPLIVFEPSLDVLKTVLSLRPFKLEDTIVENNIGRLIEILDRRLESTDRRLIAASHCSYRELFPKEFRRFQFAVQQASHNVMIRYNTVRKGGKWSEFEIENLAKSVNLPSVLALKDYCQGIPGIFVGAGPSLSKNVDILKQAKGKAVIIAATTALQPLEKAGLLPDIAAVIESNDHQYHFRGINGLAKLAVAPTAYSHPSNFHLPVKHTFSLLTYPSPVHDWIVRAYGSSDAVVTGGSVALVAFSILHKIGCNPIAGIGMDLAYSENETHAKGTDSSAVKTHFNEKTGKLEFYATVIPDYFSRKDVSVGKPYRDISPEVCVAYGGQGEVYTDIVFNSYRAWLEGAAETWASDRKLINSTEGGGRLHCFEEVPLAEVIDTYCTQPYPIEQWIDNIAKSHVPKDIQPLRTTIEEERDLIQTVIGLCQKCERTAVRGIRHIQSNALNKARKELDMLDRMEKELGALSKETRMLNQIVQNAATTIRLQRHEDKDDDELVQMVKSLNRSIRLFKEMRTGAQTALSLFVSALKNLSK